MADNLLDNGDTDDTKVAEAEENVDKAKAEEAKAEEEKNSGVDTGKGDETKTAAESEDSKKADEDKPEGAPEEYEEFTLPENMELDEKASTTFKELAKEMNLTQENAQKLVDLQTEMASEMSEKIQSQWEKVQEGWRGDAKKDEEFGGKSFDENLGLAKAALDHFGTDELKEAIDTTGMGNHPELIRFFYRVGKQLKEDGVMTEGGGDQHEKDIADKLYPTMKK